MIKAAHALSPDIKSINLIRRTSVTASLFINPGEERKKSPLSHVQVERASAALRGNKRTSFHPPCYFATPVRTAPLMHTL